MVYEVKKEEGVEFEGVHFVKGELVEVTEENEAIAELLAEGSVATVDPEEDEEAPEVAEEAAPEAPAESENTEEAPASEEEAA